MRKLLLVGSLAGMVGVAAVIAGGRPSIAQTPAPADSAGAVVLAAGDTAALPGPRQPIFFRHDIHAGQYKIPCQYCHYSVTQTTEPGIPSVQTCFGCHQVIAGTDSASRAEIRKLRTFWAERNDSTATRLEWVRIHAVARHAHFPHMRHLKALGPNACQTCHGDVARMPQIYKVNNVNNMGFCIGCHLERKVSRDCTVCHY